MSWSFDLDQTVRDYFGDLPVAAGEIILDLLDAFAENPETYTADSGSVRELVLVQSWAHETESHVATILVILHPAERRFTVAVVRLWQGPA